MIGTVDVKIRSVKTFSTDGIAVDQEAILRLRPELESRLIEDMRLKGYVPVLDIVPELYWEYYHLEQNFKYLLVLYGTFAGKKKAQLVMGMLGSHEIYFEPYQEKYETEPE